MPITVAQIFSDCQNFFSDLPQSTFLLLLNDADTQIQENVRIVPQQLIQIPVIQGQGVYTYADSAMMIWDSGYLTSAQAYQRLKPTSFDALDYLYIGWRTPGIMGTPAWIYQDGGTIGLFPPPNLTTSLGFPIVNLWVTEQPGSYLIGSSLPGTIQSEYPWVYGVCLKWAQMYHKEQAQGFEIQYAQALASLKAYMVGRNVRRKSKIITRTPQIRII